MSSTHLEPDEVTALQEAIEAVSRYSVNRISGRQAYDAIAKAFTAELRRDTRDLENRISDLEHR